MKTLVESIFDDDQTYINKSGELDPFVILKNDKKPYNKFVKWIKSKKLYPNQKKMEDMMYDWVTSQVLKRLKLSVTDYAHPQYDDNIRWDVDISGYSLDNQIHTKELMIFYLDENSYRVCISLDDMPYARLVAKVLEDCGYSEVSPSELAYVDQPWIVYEKSF